MLSQRFQIFIADLIRHGHNARAGAFKRKVMDSLRTLIPFDMALWASGHTRDLQVNNTFLYRLPQELMVSWEKVKHQDRLLQGLIQNPGVTFDVYDFYSRKERLALDTYQNHSRLFGIEHAISTAIPDPQTGLLEIMSLYRRNPDQPFAQTDLKTKSFLFPLLIAAWHENQIHCLANRGACRENEDTAICDSKGWLRHADPGFVRQIQENWPEWTGPVLPAEIQAWLVNGTSAHLAQSGLIFHRIAMGDMLRVRVHPANGYEHLTQREEEVAHAFALGLTYKEIAAELKVSPNTVRRHIESVYKKLGVATKLELFQSIHPN